MHGKPRFSCLSKGLGNLPLTLRFSLVHVITPHINAMPPHQHSIRIRMPLHGLLQKLRQVLFMRGILNDRNSQSIMIAQASHLSRPLPEALDLLEVVDLKDHVAAGALGLEQQRDQNGPLRVRVDAAAGAAAGEGGEEEGRALRGPEAAGAAQICALLEGGLLGGEGEDVDVGVFHEFLLDAGGGDVDEVTARWVGLVD